jgi:hypothetical protein
MIFTSFTRLSRLLGCLSFWIMFASSSFLLSQAQLATMPHAKERADSFSSNGSITLNSCPSGKSCTHIVTRHMGNVPSLPGQRSDMVLIGTPSDCVASPSTDESAVFTVCSVRINGLLKPHSEANLSIGDSILTVRLGGTTFIKNKAVSFAVSGQPIPAVNEQYLFFLQYRPISQDYEIITFYHVHSGIVTAMDAPSFFHLHDNRSVDDVKIDVAKSIKDERTFLRRRK